MKNLSKLKKGKALEVKLEYCIYRARTDWELQMMLLDRALWSWMDREIRAADREASAQISRSMPIRMDRASHIVERNYYRMMDHFPQSILMHLRKKAGRASGKHRLPLIFLN